MTLDGPNRPYRLTGTYTLHGWSAMAKNLYLLLAANNYASSLIGLWRCKEARALFRKMTPVTRRVLGENDEITIRMRYSYAQAIYKDGAPLDDLREAVIALEDVARTARRVLGGTHPTTDEIEDTLQQARAALRACETPSPSGGA